MQKSDFIEILAIIGSFLMVPLVGLIFLTFFPSVNWLYGYAVMIALGMLIFYLGLDFMVKQRKKEKIKKSSLARPLNFFLIIFLVLWGLSTVLKILNNSVGYTELLFVFIAIGFGIYFYNLREKAE